MADEFRPSPKQATGIPREGYALLDVIADTESDDAYNVMYGDRPGRRRRFESFADHPQQYFLIERGPNKGKKTSAAGKYQFVYSTWKEARDALKLPDFGPSSQDRAAWWKAQAVYKGATDGRDLLTDLRSGDPELMDTIPEALSGTWTSLPGGIEAATNTSRFVSAYAAALSSQRRPGATETDPPIPRPRDGLDALRARSAPEPLTQSDELALRRGAVLPGRFNEVGQGASFDAGQVDGANVGTELPIAAIPGYGDIVARWAERKRRRHQLLGEDDSNSEAEAERAAREAQAAAALMVMDLRQGIEETRDRLRPGAGLDPIGGGRLGTEGITGLPRRIGILR
jgi:muramidase (phage lysozyme)